MLHDDKLSAGIITHGTCLVQRTCSFSKECSLICCHLQCIACFLYFPPFLLSSFSLAISSFLLHPFSPPPPSLFILPHSSLSDVLSELESSEQTPYIINSSLTDYPRRSHKHLMVYLSTEHLQSDPVDFYTTKNETGRSLCQRRNEWNKQYKQTGTNWEVEKDGKQKWKKWLLHFFSVFFFLQMLIVLSREKLEIILLNE